MTIYGVTVCQQARRHSANGECRWGEGGRGITAGKVGIQYGREGGGGGGDGDRDYLVENHLICIECVDKIDNAGAIARYKKVMKSFADERTAEFIRVYFGNSAINTTELGNILPVYGDV